VATAQSEVFETRTKRPSAQSSEQKVNVFLPYESFSQRGSIANGFLPAIFTSTMAAFYENLGIFEKPDHDPTSGPSAIAAEEHHFTCRL
jgi:hypothetical protein